MPKIDVFQGLNFNDFPSFSANRSIAYDHSHVENGAWMDWKFNKSPFGKALVVLAKSEQGEVIACNAYGILNYVYKNKRFKIAMPYDTWVHKSFQGAGLFGKILREIRSAAPDAGIDGLFFFPNQESLNSLRKNDHWLELDANICYMIKTKKITTLVSKFNQIKQGFTAERCETPTYKFDFNKTNIISDENRLTLDVTAEYLKWRFSYPSRNVYRKYSGVVSDIVIRQGFRGKLSEAQIVYVGRSSGCSDAKFSYEIASTVKILLSEFDLVGLPISKGTNNYKIFNKIGFIALPSRTNFFIQPLNEGLKDCINDVSLSGIDFHTY